LIIIAGVLVMFDVIEGAGPVQGLMSIPEAFCELSLGIYLVAKGYRPSPILEEPPTVIRSAPISAS
jgi:hypothetical protein